MAITIEDCATLEVKDWKLIGVKLVKSIQYHVAELKYFKGEPYKTHEPFWFRRKGKKAVYAEDYPTRKKDGRAKPKGSSQSSFSVIPDLTLTGKMLKGLEFRHADKLGVTIGWLGNDAAKVEWNADMGRAITTKANAVNIPASDKELQIDIDDAYEKRCKASSSNTDINLKM